MSHLLRNLAPISEKAWEEIEDEAKKTLSTYLAARKLVDFQGPYGWSHSAVDVGRAAPISTSVVPGVDARLREVQPLVELRATFVLAREELERIDRGCKDPDLSNVVEAAKAIATAEDRTVFRGFDGGSIEGITSAAEAASISLSDDYLAYPQSVAEALQRLRSGGVGGPYAMALGPRCYRGLHETFTPAGYPVYRQVEALLDGPIVWAPAVDGALVLSLRGGDFELTVGQDLSIGYLAHDSTTVQLYLEESLTFRVLSPEAAIPLKYT